MAIDNNKNLEVENNDAGEEVQYTLKCKVKIDAVKYAKRFGVEVPDDSSDVELTDGGDGEGKGVGEEVTTDPTSQTEDCGQREPQDTQDASISYGSRASAYDPSNTQCKATLAQCRAKNPMTCRFHGAKAIADDIENQLRAVGVTGKVAVDIGGVNSRGVMDVEISISGVTNKAGLKVVKQAMDNFFKMPGVDGDVEDIEIESKKAVSIFDIDTLDPNAQAKWGAGQQAPSPTPPPTPQPQPKPAPQPKQAPTPKPSAPKTPVQAPTPAPATPTPTPTPPPPQAPQTASTPPQASDGDDRVHPLVKPKTPPVWNGLGLDDFETLENLTKTLAFIGQRINRNIDQGRPGPGSAAKIEFDKVERAEIEKLSKKDDSGQVAELLKIYDAVKASGKNGWTDIILPAYWDASKYDAYNPNDSMAVEKWGFDKTKCAQDPYATQRQLIKNWVDPDKERRETIDAMQSLIASAPAKEKPELETAFNDMIEASDIMASLEADIGELDEAIENEKDAAAKAELEKLLETCERVYGGSKKKYEKGQAKIKAWSDSQRWMAPGMSIQDVMDGYIARGLPPPKALVNYQKIISSHEDAAWEILKKDFGFKDSDRANVEQTWKKNVAALLDKAVFYHNTNRIDWLFEHGELVQSSCYDTITINNNGYTPHRVAGFDPEASIFCRACDEADPKKIHNWWGDDWGVVINPKKMVASFVPTLYNGATDWGTQAHKNVARTSLISDSSIATACDNTQGAARSGKVHKDALTKDLTKESCTTILSKVCCQDHSGDYYTGCNEVYAHQGIKLESIMYLKWHRSNSSMPKFTKAQKATLKKHGIKLLDKDGNEIPY